MPCSARMTTRPMRQISYRNSRTCSTTSCISKPVTTDRHSGLVVAPSAAARSRTWAVLIMRDRTLPNDLNVRVSSRASAVLLQLALLDLAVATVLHSVAFAIPPLLAALMLLVVAYWPAAPGASRPPNWRVEMGVCALLGAVVLIAVLTARFDVALLVVAAGAAVLIARRIPRFSSLRTRTGSALAVSALAAAMVLVLVDVPALLLVPLVASLGLVFALNFNVY